MTTIKNKIAAVTLAIGLLGTLPSCANAIPSGHEAPPSAKVEKKGEFYDAMASSELTRIKKRIESSLKENGNDYRLAGSDVRSSYTPPKGVEWSYSMPPEGIGYVLKVWTPAGGTFSTEETSMSLESYTEAPPVGHDHYGETAEEHAAHADEDE